MSMGGVLVGMVDVDVTGCFGLHIIIHNLAFNVYGNFYRQPASYASLCAGSYLQDGYDHNSLCKKIQAGSLPCVHSTIDVTGINMAAAHERLGLISGELLLDCIYGDGRDHLLFLALSSAASLSLWSSFIATIT